MAVTQVEVTEVAVMQVEVTQVIVMHVVVTKGKGIQVKVIQVRRHTLAHVWP